MELHKAFGVPIFFSDIWLTFTWLVGALTLRLQWTDAYTPQTKHTLVVSVTQSFQIIKPNIFGF